MRDISLALCGGVVHPLADAEQAKGTRMSLLLIALLGLVTLATFAIANGTGTIAVVAMAIFFPAAATLYFAPAIVAQEHKHPNTMAIGVLNLLAGWTVIGWIGALVWAYTKPSLRSG